VTAGLRRSKLVVLVDELGRIEGIVVIVIEGVRAAARGVRGVVVRPGLVYGPAGLHRCRGARRGRAWRARAMIEGRSKLRPRCSIWVPVPEPGCSWRDTRQGDDHHEPLRRHANHPRGS